MMRVRCNHCGWKGDEDVLRLKPDYDTEGEFCGYFELCPKCGEHDAIMDLEVDSVAIAEEDEYGHTTISTDGEDLWIDVHIEIEDRCADFMFKPSDEEIAKMKAILDRVVSE